MLRENERGQRKNEIEAATAKHRTRYNNFWKYIVDLFFMRAYFPVLLICIYLFSKIQNPTSFNMILQTVDGVPVSAILGDQQAALFGQAAYEAGEAKNSKFHTHEHRLCFLRMDCFTSSNQIYLSHIHLKTWLILIL